MKPTKALAADIAAYLKDLRDVDVPDALAVEIVFDFARHLHAGSAPDSPPPSAADLAQAMAAKRAKRAADLASLPPAQPTA